MTLESVAPPRCNIGPDEVARRRRSATVATIAAVVAALLLVALRVPPIGRLLIWPLAAAAAVTWLQVVHRFCVAFGTLGLENFGRLGQESRVDAAQLATDRRRAFLLIAQGAAAGLLVALVLVLLPI